MKKLTKIILILIIFSFLKLLYSWSINEIIKKNYNQNVYDNILVKTLYLFNFNEPYIAYYNEGNILYRIKKYDEAINKYQEALHKTKQQDKICDIRINLTLAKYQKIDLNSPNAKEELENLKETLDLNHCSGNETKKLNQEISNIQNNLKQEDQKVPNNNDQDNNNDENKDNIEKQLEEIERQARENRESDMEFYEHFNDDIFYEGDSW